MTLVIGTDEAGYGPNLGPLVVAGTAWRIDDAPAADGPEERLHRAAAAVEAALAAARPDGDGPPWADSKRVFRAGAGFEPLERGALVGLLLTGAGLPGDWPSLAAALGVPCGAAQPPEWRQLESLRLPREAEGGRCAADAAAVGGRLDGGRIGLVRIACRVLQPGDFNRMLDDGLNKSDILSRTTLELAAALRATAADEPAIVWCDRHGGRKHYAGLVSRHFDAPLVRAIEETAGRSAYAIASPPCRIEFSVGGESRVPVALASMTAKYVRELAMHAFNDFWSSQVPGLRPTAGYPVDAGRWRRDAAAGIRSLGIDDGQIWRRA
jgi:ribonuclease HII